jgi:hypothetical protein
VKPLPCPICKSCNIVVYETDEQSKSGYDAVECQNCDAIAYGYSVEDWNEIARPPEDIEITGKLTR